MKTIKKIFSIIFNPLTNLFKIETSIVHLFLISSFLCLAFNLAMCCSFDDSGLYVYLVGVNNATYCANRCGSTCHTTFNYIF